MPLFVILTHDHPFPHWDLMIEADGLLKTWRLLREPCYEEAIPAERLADHRIEYLDYEGPVSGDRGSVKRWDAGTCEDVSIGSSQETTRLRLFGRRLRGTVTITNDASFRIDSETD